MGMPADDGMKPRGLRHQVQLPHIMQYVETRRASVHDCRLGQLPRPPLRIHISAHGKHRREFLKLCQDLGLANVSRMHDQIHSGQRSRRLRPQETVCIGNGSNSHVSLFYPPGGLGT